MGNGTVSLTKKWFLNVALINVMHGSILFAPDQYPTPQPPPPPKDMPFFLHGSLFPPHPHKCRKEEFPTPWAPHQPHILFFYNNIDFHIVSKSRCL